MLGSLSASVAVAVLVVPLAPAFGGPDFSGTYVFEGFSLVVVAEPGGKGYTGTLRPPGQSSQTIPLAVVGDELQGSYTESERTHRFTARLDGATLVLTTSGGETVRFVREAVPAPAPDAVSAPAAVPSATVPSGASAVAPSGSDHAEGAPAFRRVDGATTRRDVSGAWLAEAATPQAANTLVRAALAQVARFLPGDAAPVLRSAVVDQSGREAQAIFDVAVGGGLVRGMVAVLPAGAGGRAVGLVCDEATRFGESAPALWAAIGAALPGRAAGDADAAQIKPESLNWIPVTFADGSGSMRVPEGWTVSHAANGAVDAHGPHGAVSLGAAFQVYTPAGAQGLYVRPPLVAEYSDPVTAIKTITPLLYQGLNQPAPIITRVVDTQNADYPGGQAAFIHLESEAPGGGGEYSSLSLVAMAPVSNGIWMYYTSAVVSPRESFARNLPVLMEVWKNWRISDRLMAERLKQAVETMKETGEIMRATGEHRSKTYENINTAWGHVLRGDWPVEDTRDGARADVQNTHLRPVVENLNKAAGYERFREVPTQELNQWR